MEHQESTTTQYKIDCGVPLTANKRHFKQTKHCVMLIWTLNLHQHLTS